MKMNRFLSSALGLLVLAGFASAQITSPPTITFNNRKFNSTMKTLVTDNVMGYQYVLIKNGQVVTERAGGVRQRTADSDLPMTLSTPTNIGSLTKFLSGTAMLHLMDKTQTYDAGMTVDQKLNRPFTSILPFPWVIANKPGVEMITIRQLLQHRSGFDDSKPAGTRSVLEYLQDSDGFLMSQYDQREYSNINFVLNGYLIPFYNTVGLNQTYNNLIVDQNMSIQQADSLIRQGAGISMHNIMKARIWDNLNPAISPNCDAANTLQGVAAYGYTSRNDAPGGNLDSAIARQGHCGGHGGYYMTARELANYVAHFSASNKIVSASTRNLMFNNNMSNFNDRLVWTSATPDPWLLEKFGTRRVAWSNGFVTSGYRGVIVGLPQNYYLIVLVNSKELGPQDLYDASVQAFKDAVEHNFN